MLDALTSDLFKSADEIPCEFLILRDLFLIFDGMITIVLKRNGTLPLSHYHILCDSLTGSDDCLHLILLQPHNIQLSLMELTHKFFGIRILCIICVILHVNKGSLSQYPPSPSPTPNKYFVMLHYSVHRVCHAWSSGIGIQILALSLIRLEPKYCSVSVMGLDSRPDGVQLELRSFALDLRGWSSSLLHRTSGGLEP